MSIAALAWALDQQTGSPTRKAVLLALADRYNEGESAAWPSVSWLARKTEIHPRTVQRALRDLEDMGLIAVCGWTGHRSDRMTKRYRLVIHRQEPTGWQNATPPLERGGPVSSRGGTAPPTGRHSATRTISEPIHNPPATSLERVHPSEIRALREKMR